MDTYQIGFYKWGDDYKDFFKSCEEHFRMTDCQFYFPIMSLYMYFYNTKKSHKSLDFDRRYILKEILDIDYLKYYNSNSIIKGKIFDTKHKTYDINELFCKCMPLLDPLHFIMNNYNNKVKRNPLLPSNYNYNTFSKLNDMNNTAYIDTFFGFLCSYLTISDINPSFSIYYGSVNGVADKYHFDITEEYEELKNEKWFYKNLGDLFTIDMYVDSDSDSDSESESDDSDYICLVKDIPVQLFFIEKLDGTLEDFLKKDLDVLLIVSALFQISFALHLLQKKFKFTHNDLHINNIMYTKTDKEFLYYKFNNMYFKVPTYGYLFKIIDFGRSIFTYQNKLFFNDTFNRHGEAEGQYTYPIRHLLFTNNKDELIVPNYNFDLCRLAITILDVLKIVEYDEENIFIEFIKSLTKDLNDKYLYELNDDFNMYIEIAKYANNALPSNVIQNQIFKMYRVKKKNFPKKTFYTA